MEIIGEAYKTTSRRGVSFIFAVVADVTTDTVVRFRFFIGENTTNKSTRRSERGHDGRNDCGGKNDRWYAASRCRRLLEPLLLVRPEDPPRVTIRRANEERFLGGFSERTSEPTNERRG